MKTTESLRLHAAARLDRKVSHRLLTRFGRKLPEVLIQRALVEAREAASETGWPLLVFPLLAEETVARLAHVVMAEPLDLAVAA